MNRKAIEYIDDEAKKTPIKIPMQVALAIGTAVQKVAGSNDEKARVMGLFCRNLYKTGYAHGQSSLGVVDD